MDTDEFRDRVGDLLVEAEGDLDEATMAAVLTAYAARLRDEVRFPLGMEPAEAQALRGELDDHVGEVIELEAAVTPELLDQLDLQLRAFEGPADENRE
ncbi:hypothetical protein [Halorarius halobius]|uniref:hypothetical protein n=1 Tax=Halorarius halobius TaxID=2962671 RepID=UPI0020CE736A|nr:hypothetical protein [Halorarius halobius]